MADEFRLVHWVRVLGAASPARHPGADLIPADVAEGVLLRHAFRLQNAILGEHRDEIVHLQPIAGHVVGGERVTDALARQEFVHCHRRFLSSVQALSR